MKEITRHLLFNNLFFSDEWVWRYTTWKYFKSVNEIVTVKQNSDAVILNENWSLLSSGKPGYPTVLSQTQHVQKWMNHLYLSNGFSSNYGFQLGTTPFTHVRTLFPTPLHQISDKILLFSPPFFKLCLAPYHLKDKGQAPLCPLWSPLPTVSNIFPAMPYCRFYTPPVTTINTDRKHVL